MDLRIGSLHWLQYSSFTLNAEKYVLLRNSLQILQNDNHFKKVLFWGVIQGLDSDYYIAFGYKEDAITNRSYFYSEDWQLWNLLPVPSEEHLILADLCRRPFQGDPGLVVTVVDDAPEENLSVEENTAEESGEIEQKDTPEPSASQSETDVKEPITSGELKEENRLAAVVQTITEETCIVPRGGLFKQTDGVNVHSRAFEGLTAEEADELRVFQHYRVPRQDWNTNLLTRVDYNYAIDFLDTIDKDIPSDLWTARLVDGDRTILLYCLAWPGFMFFHQLETPEHGFIYIGSGQRNLDIPFMTQVEGAATIMQRQTSITHSHRSQSSKKKSVHIEPNEQEEVEPVEPPEEPIEIMEEIITSA